MTRFQPGLEQKILLLENIHPNAKQVFQEQGFQVDLLPGSLSEGELCDRIREVTFLGIRSKTLITPKILEAAPHLKGIGAFCIGTNQIELEACANKGVAVFNAPFSNTRSVVELAIAEIIMLMRRIPERNHHMHEGRWEKSSQNSFEVRGKKLGIVGYGNIGSQLSVLAESLGMDIYYYDVVEKLAMGKAKKCNDLFELLEEVDVVSLHMDGRPENRGFFQDEHFAAMKKGAVFLNLSRGFVLDLEALVCHLKSGRIMGAAVDVFPEEPKSNQDPFTHILREFPNVILTPHIGGSTREAQFHISNYVPLKVMDYYTSGSTWGSVNFPNLQLAPNTTGHRILHLHHNKPGVLREINQVLSDCGINILGQVLKTKDQIGYCATDINGVFEDRIAHALKSIEGTLKFRIVQRQGERILEFSKRYAPSKPHLGFSLFPIIWQ